jgi:hypothetical protein
MLSPTGAARIILTTGIRYHGTSKSELLEHSNVITTPGKNTG